MMKVELNEKELKAAVNDWIEKQLPTMLKDGSAEIKFLTVTTMPISATATVEFVLTENQKIEASNN